MKSTFAILRDAHVRSGYRLWLLLALMFLVGLSDGVTVALLYPILELVGLGHPVAQGGLSTTFQWLFSQARIQPTLINTSSILISAVLIQGVVFTAQNWLIADVQKKYVAAWQRELFSGFIGAEWPFFVSQKTGEIMNLIQTEAVRLGLAFFAILQVIVATIITFVYLAMALLVSWKLTLYVLSVALLLFAFVRPIRRATRRLGRQFGSISTSVWSTTSEMLAGAKFIKASAGEEMANTLVADQLDRLRRNATWGAFLPTTNRSCFEFAGILMILGALIYGLKIEQVSAAQLLILIALVARLFPRLINIQQFQNTLNLSAPAYSLLKEIRRRFMAHQEKRQVHQAVDKIARAEICGRNIVMRYDERTVLEGISFAIPFGAVVGFVGPSGAGKSTLLDILIGLIEPTEGQIFVGSTPLPEIDRIAWRKKIGYVPQDTFLFHDTIANNIRWNAPDASPQQVEAAARAAGLDLIVSDLPLGYETIVGERGAKLSGGQRQRVSIARALVRQPTLLVLDEATSALDSLSEQEVMRVIHQLSGKMTIVAVAHRLATVRGADLIYVLDHGKIVEQGSWASLSGDTKLFNRLMQSQAVSAQ